MTLDEAIGIVCRIHTKDDYQTGFAINVGATPHFSPHSEQEWINAWAKLRLHAHMPIAREDGR